MEMSPSQMPSLLSKMSIWVGFRPLLPNPSTTILKNLGITVSTYVCERAVDPSYCFISQIGSRTGIGMN